MHETGIAFPSVSSLLEFTNEHGLGMRPELHLFAEACGLLRRDKDDVITLTQNGGSLAKIRAEARTDIAHFLIYTAYDIAEPKKRTESWSYQQIVDNLWQRAPVNPLAISSILNEELSNAAVETFGTSVSFSLKSIRGIRKWMEAISPPAIENDLFVRRSFCHPELAILATANVLAREPDMKSGIDLLLTPERREAICRLCVLEPAALDKTLNWMLPLYPQIIQPGTTAGTYGRFIRFLKWPTIADLVA
jgi:hypothetical protein